MHTQHMPHIKIVNGHVANKERFRPEGVDQIRPQFDQKVRPLSFRPEKSSTYLHVTRSGATVVGPAKGAIWLVLARIVLSDPSKSSSLSHAVLLSLRTTYLAKKDAA